MPSIVTILASIEQVSTPLDSDGRSPLHLASLKGMHEVVEALTNQGASSMNKNTAIFNWTPLHFSAYYGHSKACKILVENGADIGFQDVHGKSALHLAAQKGHGECVELLLEYGADIDGLDFDKDTPLYLAAFNKQEYVVGLLKKYGACFNKKNASGKNPLEATLTKSCLNVLKIIAKMPLESEIIKANKLYHI